MEETFRVTRTPVHEQVRDHLHQLIRAGSIEPGAALPPERELAQRLGVSRHSLRQAIASLEAVGIVETRHGSGVYLARRPSDDAVRRVADALFNETTTMAEAIEARLALEPYVARLAAERRAEDAVPLLLTAVDIRPDEDAGGGVVQEALSFHRQLARMTGNPIFEGLLRSVTTGPRNISQLARQAPDARERWRADHLAIHKAVAAGNGARAARLMTTHLEQISALARAMDAKRTTRRKT